MSHPQDTKWYFAFNFESVRLGSELVIIITLCCVKSTLISISIKTKLAVTGNLPGERKLKNSSVVEAYGSPPLRNKDSQMTKTDLFRVFTTKIFLMYS